MPRVGGVLNECAVSYEVALEPAVRISLNVKHNGNELVEQLIKASEQLPHIFVKERGLSS